ncbi:MAG: hypothetical protein ACPGVN_08405 [Alphaproteobacteria bacterium]
MKNSIAIGVMSLMLAFPTIGQAKDFNSLKVGEVTCIDVFGPWNKIGTIVDKNRSNQKVLVRAGNGKQKWHPASKTRTVWSCKITKALADELFEKGIETAVSQGESN